MGLAVGSRISSGLLNLAGALGRRADQCYRDADTYTPEHGVDGLSVLKGHFYECLSIFFGEVHEAGRNLSQLGHQLNQGIKERFC